MKGEEYRITGYGGWCWVSSTFQPCNQQCKPKPYTMHKVQDKDGVPMETSDQTTTQDAVQDTPTDTPSAAESETSPALENDAIKESDVIDVTKHLTNRDSLVFPKKWKPSVIDTLLDLRLVFLFSRLSCKDIVRLKLQCL